MAAYTDLVYGLVANIPPDYKSCDLRNFFSEFIEDVGFDCFHYVHRPAKEKKRTSDEGDVVTCCGLFRIASSKLGELIKLYNGAYWIYSDGRRNESRCLIMKVKLAEGNSGCNENGEKDRITLDRETVERLPELHPNSRYHPKGNVGTPNSHYTALVNMCQMPTKVLRKIGYSMSNQATRRSYATVGFDYGTGHTATDDVEDVGVRTGHGHKISKVALPKEEGEEARQGSEESEEEEESDDDYEEWERHEDIHGDPVDQNRNRERLYENKIELKWEKGGSGLVFYTDAQYWDKQNGDFCEVTSDDWDINFEKCNADEATTKEESCFAKKRPSGNDRPRKKAIGHFERFTKGIGRKVMERAGWRDGMGLGKAGHGIADALDNEGQRPYCKKGLGFCGEKLQRFHARKPRDDFIISTIYDRRSDGPT